MIISISYLYLYRPYILVRYWVTIDMVLVSLMTRVRFLVPKCCFISGLHLQWGPGIVLFLMRQLLNARNPLFSHLRTIQGLGVDSFGPPVFSL